MTEAQNSTAEIQDCIESLAPEWERLARHTRAAPFLWPGWTSAWRRAYGKGRLRILAAYENGRLVGVLPVHRFRGALSSTTTSETPLFAFLATNEGVAELLSNALFSQKARRIDLSSSPTGGPGASQTLAAAKVAGCYRVLAESRRAAPYLIVDGARGAYEGGLRRRFRKDVRRRRRRLEEGCRVEGSGWKDAWGTSINARPPTRRFYTEVARWAA